MDILEIPMTEDNKNNVNEIINDIDFDQEPFHHHISNGNRWLFVSYDNLSCCWVSKEIPELSMTEASTKFGFSFIDPDKIDEE